MDMLEVWEVPIYIYRASMKTTEATPQQAAHVPTILIPDTAETLPETVSQPSTPAPPSPTPTSAGCSEQSVF